MEKPCARCKAVPRQTGSYCHACSSLNTREYQARHPDKVKAYTKKYYDANAEAVKARAAKWRAAHPTYHKNYYNENYDELYAKQKDRQKAYREANRDMINEKARARYAARKAAKAEKRLLELIGGATE